MIEVNLVHGRGGWAAQEHSVGACLIPREDLLTVPQPDRGRAWGKSKCVLQSY